MTLAGAGRKSDAANISISGEDQLSGKVNYFVGNDPARWRTDVPTYAKVRYSNIYPGIDLVYYGNQRRLECDFVVAPGANPMRIRLSFAGAHLKLDPDGDLTLTSGRGDIVLHKPLIYQETGNAHRPVAGRFVLRGHSTLGISLGVYDHSKPLVIDPVLSYSTYLGSSVLGASIAVDAGGNAYITGTAGSIPVTQGAFQSTDNAVMYGGNAFVTKLNPTGTGVVYSTYLGGSGAYPTGTNPPGGAGDGGYGIAVDSSGDAYVTGYTYSYDFPNVNSYQGSNNGASNGNDNAFVTEFNPNGTALIYSTYLGGSGCGNGSGDYGSAIAVDAFDNAYVVGTTCSQDFPVTAGAFQQTINAGFGSTNAFIAKFSSTGAALDYSTYLGGGTNESGQGIAVDSSENAYVTGTTYSTHFPVTTGAFQSTNNSPFGGNGFVTKLNPTGTGLSYSTYLGGNGGPYRNRYGTTSIVGDSSAAIAVDSAGNAYVTGGAGSTNFPVTAGAFQIVNNAQPGLTDAFVAKLNSTGTALIYCTYLGGSGGSDFGDSGAGTAIDGSGNVYIVGKTGSINFPVTPGAVQMVNNGAGSGHTNAFVSKLNSTGTALDYSTYLGGNGGGFPYSMFDYGSGIAVDANGAAYLTGATDSSDFPTTPGAFDTSGGGGAGNSAFIAKLALGSETTGYLGDTTSLTSNLSPAVVGQDVKFTASVVPNSGTATPTGSVVFSVDGNVTASVALSDSGTADWSTSSLTAGQHAILASYAGSSVYTASSAAVTETITPATPVISWPAPAAITYGTALSATQLDATSTVAGAFAYTPASGTVLSGGAQTLSVTLTPTDTTDYTSATAMVTLTVKPAAQTITFPAIAAVTYGAAPFGLSATASSGLTVGFESTTTPVCTVSVATVTLVEAGTCTIKASQAGNGDYAAATNVYQSFYVHGEAQTITFPAIPETTLVTGSVTLDATASSGLPVSYASTTTSVCTVSASTATLVALGTCSIEAKQAGNAGYDAASWVTRSFKVTLAPQTITFPTIAAVTFGASPFGLSATASSGLAVSFTSTTTAACTVSGATVTLVAAGTCTIKASQAGNADYTAATNVYQSFAVHAEAQTITFPAIPATQLSAGSVTLSATASSGLPVSYASTTTSVCTVSGSTATLVAVGTCTIEAKQPGNSGYAGAAWVTQSFKVTAN